MTARPSHRHVKSFYRGWPASTGRPWFRGRSRLGARRRGCTSTARLTAGVLILPDIRILNRQVAYHTQRTFWGANVCVWLKLGLQGTIETTMDDSSKFVRLHTADERGTAPEPISLSTNPIVHSRQSDEPCPNTPHPVRTTPHPLQILTRGPSITSLSPRILPSPL